MILRCVLSFLMAGAMVGCAFRTSAATRLPFIEDDYARALAEAKSRTVPLFVEVWAPW
jgi:hypothetical protein